MNTNTSRVKIMAIELLIQKWGNSAAVRLPAPLLAQLDVHLGDKFAAKVCHEGLMLIPVKQKLSLDALFAQCDINAELTQDVKAWDESPLVGNER